MTLPDEIEAMLQPHLGRALLVDANLLLLLLLGTADRSSIGRGRLSRFEPVDFVVTSEICSRFPHQFTTPHVLSQVSDLARHDMGGKNLEKWCNYLVGYGREAREIHIPLADAEFPILVRLGLADAGLLKTCLGGPVVLLSVDHELCGIVNARKGTAINYNHVADMMYG